MSEIVIVDDDAEVLEINYKYLKKEGYDIKPFTSSYKALKYLKENNADCVVLDVMMPQLDGFQTCQKIRKFSDVPIIFLSGKVAEEDKVKGLVLGGDDYMEKPYNLKELSTRIMVNVRRHNYIDNKKNNENILDINSLKIDLTAHRVFYHGDEEIILSNQEYDLLMYMINNHDRDVTYEEIGNQLHGSYIESDRRNIMVSMSRLRKKLEEYSELQFLIETVWAKGYRYNTK